MSLTLPTAPTRKVPDWVRHDGVRYRAVAFETSVDADIDTVWAEVAGNYVGVVSVQPAIVASYGLPGEPEVGPGADRHCDIDFNGRDVAIKERIIDWIDEPAYKEYTYDVYESKGFPARVFNTWSVRRGSDGKTYLRNVFYFRMKPFVMTYFSVGQIKGAARGGVLGYKYFLETGRAASSSGRHRTVHGIDHPGLRGLRGDRRRRSLHAPQSSGVALRRTIGWFAWWRRRLATTVAGHEPARAFNSVG